MSDLLTLLRQCTSRHRQSLADTCNEAADEIERLRAALKKIKSYYPRCRHIAEIVAQANGEQSGQEPSK